MAKEDERLGRGRSRQPAPCEELHPPRIPHVLLQDQSKNHQTHHEHDQDSTTRACTVASDACLQPRDGACRHAFADGVAFAHLMVLHIHLPPDYVNPSVCAQELCGDQRGELACDRGVEGQFVDRARDHEEAVADRQRAREGK